MKQINRQTSPLGRSTKAEYAGLSLLHLQLFTVVGDTYKYYNEIVKNVSDFITRLISKKFNIRCIFHVSWHDRYFRRELNDLIDLRFRAA